MIETKERNLNDIVIDTRKDSEISGRSFKNSEIGKSINSRTESNYHQQELLNEFEDPGNEAVKGEIQKLLDIYQEADQVQIEQELSLTRKKSSVDKINEYFRNSKVFDQDKMSEFDFVYKYTSYFKGLNNVVQDFLNRQIQNNKSNTKTNLNLTNSTNINGGKTSSKSNLQKNINPIKNLSQITFANINQSSATNKKLNLTNLYSNAALEYLYNSLGHEVYTKIIAVYEKYCLYGKTNTSFHMDYTQFVNFLNQNNLQDEEKLTKIQTDLVFNKVSPNNKCITYEDFILILIEMSQIVFNWEKNVLKSFSYFVSKYIVNIPCLKKSLEEKNIERWYLFLEFEEFTQEIKKHLPDLNKIYLNYKVKDLKLPDCISTGDLIRMSKDLKIIPVFLTSKEIITIINFVKYKSKSVTPTNLFNFCSFVEIICVISLQAFDKYIHEEGNHQYIEHVEKLKKFMAYIHEKM